MILCPKFQYPKTTGTTLQFTISQRRWKYRDSSVGGSRASASDLVATRVIRRDRLLDVTLRFEESERADVIAMIEWMQEHPNTAAQWWPDGDVAGTSEDVLLRDPMPGKDIQIDDGDVGGVYETTITLKKADGSAWDLDFYGF